MLYSDTNVSTSLKDGTLIAYICGDIDHHNAKAARRRIDRETESNRPTQLILDLSGVNFMDSSGLGLILGRLSRTRELGIDFAIKSPTNAIMKILELAGGERLIRIIK